MHFSSLYTPGQSLQNVGTTHCQIQSSWETLSSIKTENIVGTSQKHFISRLLFILKPGKMKLKLSVITF